MSGDKVLVKTMRQVSNADSDLILEKQNDIPSISEIKDAYLLLNNFLKQKGEKRSGLALITEKKTFPSYQLHNCLVSHFFETPVYENIILYRNRQVRILSVHLEHVIKIAGSEEIVKTVSDYLNEKIRRLFLENIQKLDKKTYNTLEEEIYVYSRFRYAVNDEKQFFSEKPLSGYSSILELEQTSEFSEILK